MSITYPRLVSHLRLEVAELKGENTALKDALEMILVNGVNDVGTRYDGHLSHLKCIRIAARALGGTPIRNGDWPETQPAPGVPA